MENSIEWISISGYEGFYEVSSSGTIRSLQRIIPTKTGLREVKGKLLAPRGNGQGYNFVELCNEESKVRHYIHRLVAQAFIPNPENKPQVNHLDGNKAHNDASNLEWATNLENAQHAYQTALFFDIGKLKHTSLALLDKSTNVCYNTIKEAAIALNKNYSMIRGMLKGYRKNTSPLEYCTTCYK